MALFRSPVIRTANRSPAKRLKIPAAVTTNSEKPCKPVGRGRPVATCSVSGATKRDSGEIRTTLFLKSSSRKPKTPGAESSLRISSRSVNGRRFGNPIEPNTAVGRSSSFNRLLNTKRSGKAFLSSMLILVTPRANARRADISTKLIAKPNPVFNVSPVGMLRMRTKTRRSISLQGLMSISLSWRTMTTKDRPSAATSPVL